MSDETEEVKKKYEIALAMAAIASMDIEIEAASARVRAIKRQLIVSNALLTALASLPRRRHREVWAEVTNMREPVAIEKRVAVGLYKLCSSAEDRTVAHLFGIGRSTVNVIYKDFCETVVSALDDMAEHIREFQAVCGFPQGIEALDGCHIPVSPPKEHASDYYNYKGW
ncbi:hypothetical protein HPB47_014297 [Ixodes persulcatus]|uniref:Uncharacterized protein n=1 Tax=Ixodes persulcatus TaxID=34615 RepID=A0AC60QYZ3_IXOPE|nr:hypothetical protein HPB47_014297 [Ixodes persulcatus]